MWPAASVSGYYFGHEQANILEWGRITEEQVNDYAKRRGIELSVARKWLAPNLVD